VLITYKILKKTLVCELSDALIHTTEDIWGFFTEVLELKESFFVVYQ